MKTPLILLIAVLSFNAMGQSFYHKKMKKANTEVKHCEAMKPRHTFIEKVSQKKLYTSKRRKARKA